MTAEEHRVAAEENRPRPWWAAVAAFVATLIAPIVSLIVGGAMLVGEQDADQCRWLRGWLDCRVLPGWY